MKYALFSDIHGNIYAFEAMMNALCHEKIDGYLFCGDLTGYYYHSVQIMEAVRMLPNFHAVRGNHDSLFLEASTDKAVQREAAKKYGSSYNNLNVGVAEYIRTLPETATFRIGNFNAAILHGSPASPLCGRIYPDSKLDMPPPGIDFLFCGHTHYQMLRPFSANCMIVNPGSLGQPRDGNGFSYYIVDFTTGMIERRSVAFDLSPLFREIKKNDMDIPYLTDVLKRNGR